LSLKDEFTKAINEANELVVKKRKWVPGVEWLGNEGTVTTDALQGDPNWDSILVMWGLDPHQFQIVEPVLFNSWGGEDGLTNRQYKAKVIKRSHTFVDIEPLIEKALKQKPKSKTYEGSSFLNVVLADWQIGKADGDGLEGTIQRVIDARDAVVLRVKELRKIGRDIAHLNVLWTGDSVEGCMGHYPSQTFAVEIDRRDQVKITRRLLVDSLQEWAKHFESITVAAVGGNHGENRNNGGKAFTGTHDNDDLAIVEQVSEILAANQDAYGHINFAIAKDNLTATVPAGEWIIGITHGHVANRGDSAESRLRTWWQKQAAGRQAIGDADILVSGHYHHFRMADWGGCLWMQSPALDGGSDWWRASQGEVSETGMLTFVTTSGQRVCDIAVL